MARLADLENRIETVAKMVKAVTPQSGTGIDVTDVSGGGGKMVSLRATPVTSGPPAANTHPFELVDVSDDSGNAIRVVYGTVGDVVPDGMSPGDVPPYVLAISISSGYVYLIVTTDSDYLITDVSIDVAATVPDDDEGTFTYYCSIGSFDITDGILSPAQGISGSQAWAWCGSAKFALS